MASSKAIRQRIRSIRNTAQITKAMEVVSATKMRRSQEFAVAARPYAIAALEILENLLSRTPELPPLLRDREVRSSALLVATSDKGLAGAFNSNVIKKADLWVEAKRQEGHPFTLITVGRKARDHFERRRAPIAQRFWGFGDSSTLDETLPVAEVVMAGFLEGQWDEVEASYTHFRTTLTQEAVVRRILPVTEAGIEGIIAGILPERGRYARGDAKSQEREGRYRYEYLFEPSPAEILGALVPRLIRMHIHHIILESNASEHSSRMVAMKNASDNATDLISELTLVFNKARQAGITRELTEITAGTESLEQ